MREEQNWNKIGLTEAVARRLPRPELLDILLLADRVVSEIFPQDP